MKTKGLSMRPKTLRSGLRATPASMHLEITMLLHQEQRLQSELEFVRSREKELESLLAGIAQQVERLTALSFKLDPKGACSSAMKRSIKKEHRPGKTVPSSCAGNAHENETVVNNNYQAMPLDY